MKVLEKYRHIVALLVVAAVLFVIALRLSSVMEGIGLLWEAVFPLVVGAVLAFVLDIVVRPFERIYFPTAVTGWKASSRRPVSILLALIAIGAVIFIISALAIPQLIHSLGLIVQAVPAIYRESMVYINDLLAQYPMFAEQATHTSSWQEGVNYITRLGSQSGQYLVNTMSNVVSVVVNAVIGLIFAIYILLDKDILKRQVIMLMEAYVKNERIGRIEHIAQVTSKTFRSFFVGQFLDALILGIMVGIGLWITQVSYAVTIGCVVGLTALVPLLGAYIGGLMGIIMLLAVSPMEALIFLIVFVVMQQIEGNIIYPRIVGGSVGLPGIWVFAAITVGGSLYGITGILLSVPIAATLYKLLVEDVKHRLHD